MKFCLNPSCALPLPSDSARSRKYCNDTCKGAAQRARAASRGCTVSGCRRDGYQAGMCSAHYQRLRKTGTLIPTKDVEAPIGSKKPAPDGYILLRVPAEKQEAKWVYEHRHVMEQYLGRKLIKGENVHHKNGDRSDNDIRNLELWTKSQPSGQRVEDKIEWAKSFLSSYGHTVHSPYRTEVAPWTVS